MNTLLENLLIFLFGILLPLWLCFKVKKTHWAILIIILALYLIFMFGTMFIFQGPFMLFFGWVPFLIEKIPQITPSWQGLAMALTSLVLLVYGGHWFLRWLYSHWGQVQASDSPRLWPMRWTLSLVALLVLFFSASIGFIGATHQTAWMIGADKSLVEYSWGGSRDRVYNSDAKSNLHNVYLACKAYWADHGSEKSCTRQFYRSTTFGYIQSAEVVVQAGGSERDFHAVAGHLEGDRWFWINPLGKISELELPELNTKKQS